MYLIGEEEIQAVREVIESGKLFRYQGDELSQCDRFEQEWAELLGVEHALLVTSGTAALTCALAGLEIGPDDEVIVPGYTFMASALAPLAVGAVPVLAEVDESLTLDPADVERRITPRTRAIMPVHMIGLPCNLEALGAIARRRGLALIEDACQADGGSYRGRRLGSWGDVGGFSFNYFKIIACGEGGAVVTSRREVFERARIFHDGGAAFRSWAEEVNLPFFAGINFRFNEILAAVLRVQLQRLEGILARLRAEKCRLREQLSDLGPCVPSPVHDLEGDCAVQFCLLFESEPEMRSFLAAAAEEGVPGAWSPLDSGRHVYTNWEPIMERHGAHVPARDPFQVAREIEYSLDTCARTLDVLGRTVCLPTAVDRSEEALGEVIAAVKRAADRVRPAG